MIVVLMLFVLIMGVASVSASEDINDSVQATDENDDVVVSTSDTEAVSIYNDNEKITNANKEIIDNSNIGSIKTSNNDSSEQKSLLESTSNDKLSDTMNSFTDLKNEVSSSSKEITLSHKYYKYSSADGGAGIGFAIKVTNKIINGNGATIDGNNIAYPFQSDGSVTFKNINFINTINNGANIASSGGTLVFNTGANDIVVENCNFSNTQSPKGFGGAISIYDSLGNITIKNCIFENTTARNTGSILIHASSDINTDKITIEGCAFNNISSTFNGPIIFRSASNVDIKNCKFTNTVSSNRACIAFDYYATNFTAKNCIFDKTQITDAGSARGIGIQISNGVNCLIDNCNITNVARGGYGGGITIGAGASYCNNITINHCNFINITTGSSGTCINTGGHDASNNVGFLNIYNCNFDSNNMMSNSGRGSAIELNAHHASIVNCTFSNNHAEGSGSLGLSSTAAYCLIQNCDFINNSAYANGGAINVDTGSVNIIDSTFTNNKATNGAAVYVASGATANIDGSTFTSNQATGEAAVYYAGSGSLTDSTFESNAAATYANVYKSSTVTMTDNEFKNTIFTISANDIMYGANEVITGTFNAGVNFNPTITLRYNNNLLMGTTTVSNNQYSFTWTTPKAGNYTVYAVCSDGNTYVSQNPTATFEVKQYATEFSVTVSDYKVQQDVIIYVDTGKTDATGIVDVLFGTTVAPVTLTHGKAQLNVGKVQAGRYEVSASYRGDDKYQKTQNGTSFTVTKYATTTNLVLTNVKVGNAVSVAVTVTSSAPFDVNGKLILIGTGENKTVTITKGSGSINVADLPAGRYVVSCTIKKWFYEL